MFSDVDLMELAQGDSGNPRNSSGCPTNLKFLEYLNDYSENFMLIRCLDSLLVKYLPIR